MNVSVNGNFLLDVCTYMIGFMIIIQNLSLLGELYDLVMLLYLALASGILCYS